VLVCRKWSGKTLAGHRGERKAWLMDMLDLPAIMAAMGKVFDSSKAEGHATGRSGTQEGGRPRDGYVPA
jgi:hypothetical protein